jgi:uncharacterized membrane protein YgdD (TMEM256/DUF423 family)
LTELIEMTDYSEKEFRFKAAASLGASAVAFGAFGAHALVKRFPGANVASWTTASTYHMYGALTLLALSVTPPSLATGHLSSRLLLAGHLVFSGSIYWYVLCCCDVSDGRFAPRVFGVAITLCFLLQW